MTGTWTSTNMTPMHSSTIWIFGLLFQGWHGDQALLRFRKTVYDMFTWIDTITHQFVPGVISIRLMNSYHKNISNIRIPWPLDSAQQQETKYTAGQDHCGLCFHASRWAAIDNTRLWHLQFSLKGCCQTNAADFRWFQMISDWGKLGQTAFPCCPSWVCWCVRGHPGFPISDKNLQGV